MTLKLHAVDCRTEIDQAPNQLERLEYVVGMIDSLREITSQTGYTTLQRMLDLVAVQAMDERIRLLQTTRSIRNS